MHNKISTAQLRAHLTVAAVPTILSVAGRNGWLTSVMMAVGCGALCFCVLSCRIEKFPKWFCVIEIVWMTVFLAGVAKMASGCWVEANESTELSVILLLVAACATIGGAHRSARVGATLLWLVIPILAVVFITGATNIDPNLLSAEIELPNGTLFSSLLLPCVTVFLPKEQKSLRWTGLVWGVVAVAASLVMRGTMGAQVSETAPNSFYEFSKGVTLFHVAERFEAIVACALTGGLFALLALILSGIYHLTGKIFCPAATWSIWLCAAVAAGLMCILPKGDYWMMIGGVIFWGFLPVSAQGLGGAKNLEKK